MTKLIIGLGNPGRKYNKTRHNIGFSILEGYQKSHGDVFCDFMFNKKFDAEISEGNLGKKKVLLLKPHTFMNQSGRSVRKVMDYYDLGLQDIVVVHDDSDLFIGKIKIRKGRGNAGHKGLQSIDSVLGSNDYIRISPGIRDSLKDKSKKSEVFVLKPFPSDKKAIIRKVKKRGIQIIDDLVENQDLEKTISQYAGSV